MKRFLLATLTCSFVAVTASADWAQYLGPNRNDVATDAVLARSWPKSCEQNCSKQKLWKSDIAL